MKIEDIWGGAASGLIGEVITEDTYRIKELKFTPTIIFDLGCNIGIFTQYVRSLFPDAFIVSVEPNEENFKWAKYFTPPDDKILFINKAIGIGQIYHGLTAANGSGETYLSIMNGYPQKEMDEAVENNLGIERSEVETVMPDELINTFTKEGDKVLVKIDCEGAENIIFSHEPSMEALRKCEYVCIEVHRYALSGGELWQKVQDKTRIALDSFKEMHYIEEDGVHFWATKKAI